MKKFCTGFSLIVLSLLITHCGQRGALYLPPDQTNMVSQS